MMEAIRIILVMMFCLFVTIIVCSFMRPDPCTHNSTPNPGSDFVTSEIFTDVMEEQMIMYQANLDALQIITNMIEQNKKMGKLNHDMILKTANKMVLVLKLSGLE